MNRHNRVRPTETTLTISELVETTRQRLAGVEFVTDPIASARASLSVARMNLERLREAIEDTSIAIDEAWSESGHPAFRRALSDLVKINETIGKPTAPETTEDRSRVASR